MHGCMPVILALHDLREQARDGFLYSPGVVLYRNIDDRQPEAEIDILCIADGKLVLGEVKSSASEFNPAELQKLATLGRELRADRLHIFSFRDENSLMEGWKLKLAALAHPECEITAGVTSEWAFEPKPHT
jgi:hypothetical protein